MDGLWEAVDTTNDSWGYAWYDENWKDTGEVLRRLIRVVARGGNYMLSIGPRGDGTTPETCADFLTGAGPWLKRYGKAIYGAGPSPWQRQLLWGDCTVQGNTLYLGSAQKTEYIARLGFLRSLSERWSHQGKRTGFPPFCGGPRPGKYL